MAADDLLARLRLETGPLHSQVERSLFMRAMLAGQVHSPVYALFLRQLHPIYHALEAGLRRHLALPGISHVFMPELAREGALVNDLHRWYGPAWSSGLAILPATHSFVERLAFLTSAKPQGLVAHAYVRYLGDLSGGQLLRKAVQLGLGLPETASHAGLAFYEFGPPEHVRALAATFRRSLADVAKDSGQVDSVVDEAKHAFELHGRLFDELADAMPGESSPITSAG